MRVLAAILSAAVLGLTSAGALAQQTGPGGPEIWDTSDTAAPRHWFTGLRCPAEMIGLPLSRHMAFDPTGADVGCFYQSAQSDDYVTVYATKRYPIGAPLQTHVDRTWAEVRGRYSGATELSAGERAVDTPAGPLAVRELVLGIDGRDSISRRDIRAVTGAWLADVGGWTLKVRLTGGRNRDLDWARTTADGVLARAAADMTTARDCEGAGAEAPAPPPAQPNAMTLTLAATMMSMQLVNVVPRTPEAARAAGFVCLGEALETRSGKIVVAVTPRIAGVAAAGDMRLLALGEIRGVANPPMVAVFEMDAASFGAGEGRVHVVYSFAEGGTAYLGAAADPPRLSAAYGAGSAAEGAPAPATVR